MPDLSGELAALPPCPICGARPVERFRARFVPAAKCGGCGHLYAVEVASAHGVQELPDPDRALATYAARNRRLIARWSTDGFVGPGKRVLDFGAGAGHVLRALAAQVPGLDIDAIEADPGAAAYLTAQGFAVLPRVAEAPAGRYDAILLIELLEHLADPVGFLRDIRACLAPGGRIFATTPIGETRSGNRDLPTYDTAEHVQFWTEGSFALACEKSGLSFRRIHPGLMYPRHTRFEALARDPALSARDAIQGPRHLVGYLSPVD